MLSLLDAGPAREVQAILSLYLATLLTGYNFGFSAVAVPDIKQEMRWRVCSDYPSSYLLSGGTILTPVSRA